MKIRKLLLVFIISIMFMPFVVNAETCENDKISIESIETKSISDNAVEKNDPTINGMGVKLDLEMSEVGDKVEYEMTIKNDSNTDYKLDKNSLKIESDYIDYTFETKDKTNIVKAKSSSEAVLTVQYKNEVPEELLENGSYNDNKTFNIGMNDGKNSITETVNNIITNPKTGQSLLFIMCLVLMVIVISLVVLKKNKKIGTLVLLLGLLSLPFSVYALCSINLKVESNIAVKKIVECHEFSNESSWEDIIESIQNNATECMNVGDTKEVDMGTFGTHTLRIANTSTPAECSTEGFSQTACGLVLEFADIITTHNMNSTMTNVGGWPASDMRTYINTDIYNALPSELKNAIISTKVISGYGCLNYDRDNKICNNLDNSGNNFESTDKLYLLSMHEVWEDVDGNTSNGPDYYDTAYSNTRQLDYYNNLGVTTSNYSGAIKKDSSNSASEWWLRSAISTSTYGFYIVRSDGRYNAISANYPYGVSPAFRIG